MNLEELIKEITKKTGLDITRDTNERDYVTAKYMFISLAYQFSTASQTKIASMVKRKHAIVQHAVETLSYRLNYEPEMAIIYNELIEKYAKMYTYNTNRYAVKSTRQIALRRKKLRGLINGMSASQLQELEQFLN